jgi:drug/metabolite transporter (DMT)-like permease
VFGVSFSLLVGFIASLKSADEQWRLPARHELPYVLGVCISGTSAHFLLNYAAKLLPATLAGLIRSSDIFWAYALEVLVLGQHPKRETYWGLSVCFSLILVLISSNKRTMKLIGSVGNLTTAK